MYYTIKLRFAGDDCVFIDITNDETQEIRTFEVFAYADGISILTSDTMRIMPLSESEIEIDCG